jgi:hypothetical protein
MVATAKDDVVSATADIAESQTTPGGDMHHTSSRTKVQLTGPATATAEAYSHADDISLAGGVVTIGSFTSTAKGSTDGQKASASGTTLVNDVKIGGVPVTIDEHGVTVAGTNNPLNKTASDAVNQAIKQAGMSIAVSQPTGKPVGSSVVYSAGSLVFMWTTPGGTFTAILGGATVELAASSGDGFSLDSGSVPAFTPPEAPAAPGVAPQGGAIAPAASQPGSDSVAAPAVAPQGVAPVLSAGQLPLPGSPSPVGAVLGLLGVGLLAAGMRQLPDRVLEARANTCLLGERR